VKTTSLRRRLSFTYAGVAVLTAAVLGAVLLTILRLYYDQQELDYLANQARSISANLAEPMGSGTMRDLSESVVRNALRADVRVRLLDADGGLLADSGDPRDRPMLRLQPGIPLADGGLDSRVREPRRESGVVDDSTDPLAYYGPVSVTLYGLTVRLPGTGILHTLGLGTGQSTDVRSSHAARVPVLSANASNPVGWVEVTAGPSYGRPIVTVVAWAWVLASSVAVMLSAAIGWLASRRITHPISSLTSVTSRMAGGDLAARAPVASGDEIGTLAASFNSMAERVEETVAVLRRFVGDAAHEIHTPLTALRANLALAMDGDDPGHHRLFLERVRDQARRMEELTNDLLDLSQLETGPIEIRRLPLDLAAAVREVSEVYASRAEQAGITFCMDLPNWPVTILGDESQVRRALANLLDNAVKFTPTDGTVRVGLASNGALVEVSVADSGIGIPPEDLPNLFSRFRRGRNASAFPGSGLGLAIVKAIMEYHGGQVLARSLDPGTVFTLSWPSGETTAE
jgi:signal transduction histidine kinase